MIPSPPVRDVGGDATELDRKSGGGPTAKRRPSPEGLGNTLGGKLRENEPREG
jgi:hypothetical protein